MDTVESKFSMTREENIFVAKRYIIDYIWKSAKLEGLGVTYPDTEAIYHGMRAPNVTVEEIVDVLKIEEPTERAITHMLYLMRNHMFLDDDVIIRTKLEKSSKIKGLH